MRQESLSNKIHYTKKKNKEKSMTNAGSIEAFYNPEKW